MAKEVRIIDGKGNYVDGTGADTSDLTSLATGIVMQECVFDENSFAVTERGAGADMSVDVSAGNALVKNDSYTDGSVDETRFWPVCSDAVTNVTIAANSSGNPRIDIIILEVDNVTPPNDDGSNVFDISVVQGTPAGSPSAPATPSNAYKIAEVAVANGASSIVNANITDTRVFLSLMMNNGRLFLGSSIGGANDDPIIKIDTDNYTDIANGDPALVIQGGANKERIHVKSFGASVIPSFQGLSGRGTLASPTATQSGDVLVQLRGDGIDNAAAETGSQGSVKIIASQNFTTTAQGTKILLQNTADGSTTLVDAAHIYRGGGGALNIVAQGNHITLEPNADGNYVEIARMPRRNHSSTTYVDSHIQRGWSYKQGDGTGEMLLTCTLPIAYSSSTTIGIVANFIGERSTGLGVPTNEAGFNNPGGPATYNAYALPGASTSTFTVVFACSGTFSSSFYFGVSWIAIGPN